MHQLLQPLRPRKRHTLQHHPQSFLITQRKGRVGLRQDNIVGAKKAIGDMQLSAEIIKPTAVVEKKSIVNTQKSATTNPIGSPSQTARIIVKLRRASDRLRPNLVIFFQRNDVGIADKFLRQSLRMREFHQQPSQGVTADDR
jgi:hypothetical protein